MQMLAVAWILFHAESGASGLSDSVRSCPRDAGSTGQRRFVNSALWLACLHQLRVDFAEVGVLAVEGRWSGPAMAHDHSPAEPMVGRSGQQLDQHHLSHKDWEDRGTEPDAKIQAGVVLSFRDVAEFRVPLDDRGRRCRLDWPIDLFGVGNGNPRKAQREDESQARRMRREMHSEPSRSEE